VLRLLPRKKIVKLPRKDTIYASTGSGNNTSGFNWLLVIYYFDWTQDKYWLLLFRQRRV